MPGMSPHMKIKKGRPLANWPGGNTPPVINITAFDAAPDISGNPFTTEYIAVATDAEQGDISASIVWRVADQVAVAATSGEADAAIAGAPAGTVVPGVATQNWEVDVDLDVGVNQQLIVAVNILDDYDDIAALISTQIAGGSCVFVGGAFKVSSDTLGVASTAVVAAGTAGVTSDLFAAITAAAVGNPVITFPAPTAGVDAILETLVVGGSGGTPSLTFLVAGSQTVEAEITDGFGSTVVDSETINVTNI